MIPIAAFRQPSLTAYFSLVALGLTMTVPFIQPIRVLPFPSFYSEWLTFVLGIIACAPLLNRRFWEPLIVPRSCVFLLAFIGVIAVQTIWTSHAYIAQPLLPALYIAFMILVGTVATWVRNELGRERTVVILASFLLVGGIIQALIGLAQYLDNPGWFAAVVTIKQTPVILGNSGQANHFAAYLIFALIALAYLFATKRMSNTLTAVVLLFLAFMLTLSGSRSALLFLVALMLLSSWIYRSNGTAVYGRLMIISGTMFALFLALQFVTPAISDWLDHPVMTAGEKTNLAGGIELRLTEWKKALFMFTDAPILGVGIANYGWHSFLLQATPEFSATSKPQLFHQSHNIFMQTLAELGIVGLVVLLAIIFGWLKPFAQRKIKDAEWFLAGAILLVLFIHANLEFPLSYSYFLTILITFAAIEEERVYRITFTPSLGRAAAAVSFLIVALILGVTHYGFRQLHHVNSLIVTMSPGNAALELHRISKNLLLQPWAERVLIKHGQPHEARIEQQLAMTTRQMRYQPASLNVYQQVTYLATAGHHAQALTLLNQAALAYPNDLSRYVGWLEQKAAATPGPLLTEAKRLLGSGSLHE